MPHQNADPTRNAAADPAAPDHTDEGDPSMGAHQGANHTNRELHARGGGANFRGPKTRAAIKRTISRKD